jgi:hypothetical protein
VIDDIDGHHVVTLRGPIKPGAAEDALRRSRPAPRVDPGLQAFGAPLWAAACKGEASCTSESHDADGEGRASSRYRSADPACPGSRVFVRR